MKEQEKEKASLKIDFFLILITLVIIVIAWYIGAFKANTDIIPFLEKTLPEADFFELQPGGIYVGRKNEPENKIVGYLFSGSDDGYGGQIKVMVAVSNKGAILNTSVIEHKETPSFFQKVNKKGFIEQFTGKIYSDPFQPENDVDIISGATSTCSALSGAIRNASRNIASKALNMPVPKEPPPSVQFGIPEICILILFIFGYIGTTRFIRAKKTIRWISMLFGMIILGFAYNIPLNTILINKLLLGYWPVWQTNLYLYILIGLIFLLLLTINNNLYCDRICPFGAAQECIGLIGGTGKQIPKQYRQVLLWIQRLLALTVIVLAFAFRNPAIFSYEVFSVFFHLLGNLIQFVLLGLVLIFALFIKRPWCNYLCPIRPVINFIQTIRNWILEAVFKTKYR